MNDIVIKKLLKSLIEFEITVPEAEVLAGMNSAANKISADVGIKGFRKGTVPANILEQHIGKEKIFEEACYLIADKKFAKAVESEKIKIISRPKMEILKMAIGNPFVFKITVPVYPDIELADYKAIAEKIKGEKKEVEIKEEEMQESIKWLQKSRRKEVLVNRPAKKGDLAEVDFEARVGGVKLEGGESRNHPLVLGESKFISGFDEQVENMSTGESKNFSLIAPADFTQASLRGKKIDFQATLKAVYELALPEIDDQFAASLGSFKDLNALKENIKAGIKMEKEAAEKDRLRQLFAKRAAEESKIEVADALIDEEMENMARGMKHNLEEQGLNFDDYLSSIKKSGDELKKDLKAPAELRVKTSMIFPEISKREEISVSDEELEKKANELVSRRSEFEKFKADPGLLKRYVYSMIVKEKVFEILSL